MIAKIAVDKVRYEIDTYYSYNIPEKFSNYLCVGSRVVVPFGRGNNKRQGIVMEITKENVENIDIKSIFAVLDEAPLLSNELFDLICWMKENYFCSIFEAYRTVISTGINMNVNISYKLNNNIQISEYQNLCEDEIKLINYIKECRNQIKSTDIVDYIGEKYYNKIVRNLIELGIIYEVGFKSKNVGEKILKNLMINDSFDINTYKMTPKQKKVYEFIKNSSGVTTKEVCYFTGVTKGVIDNLIKKCILKYDEKIIYSSPNKEIIKENRDYKDVILSSSQDKAYEDIVNEIREGKENISLLHGVTGSGKTSIFMKLIDYVLEQEKEVILMVPEISLTAQLISLFRNRYGDNISVFHSNMSVWERFDEWKRAKDKKTKIAIGTRTAIFAPFENLGLIIMDEEQEYTYKSDAIPRFHARDIAKYRCKYNKCMLLLASATPSIESYFMAQKGIYSLHKLKGRYGNAKLPDVKIVDMNEEIQNGNSTLFSSELIENIKRNMEIGCQSILLLNRRGYHTFAKCRACGEVLTCPNCNISLTYHSDNNRLMCHYCGYSKDFTKKCSKCKENEVIYAGIGTQRAEDTLKELIPDLRVVRVDADTTIKKHSHQNIFKEFEKGNYDVMLGTQMVAKGLNFPNVTLVGILSADQTLYNDDFRSYERAFSLITQVVGRAGRGDKPGTAIIQTYTPESEVINMASNQDYESFYESEIPMRKLMLYPPYADICVIGFTGIIEKKVKLVSLELFEDIKKIASNKYKNIPLRIFKPIQASINKIGGKYRYKMIIKCRNNKIFRSMVSDILMMYNSKSKNKGVNIFVDINPDTIL